MPVPNPVNCYLGNKQVFFTYEGGEHLYNFCPNDCGMSDYMESNLFLWADHEQHAKQVVIRMLEWFIENNKSVSHDEYTQSRSDRRSEQAQAYLDNQNKIKCTLVPTNQMYKVHWASNDTFI